MPRTTAEIAQENIAATRGAMNPLIAHLLGSDINTVAPMNGGLIQDLILQPNILFDIARHYCLLLNRIAGTHRRGEITPALHANIVAAFEPVRQSVFPSYFDNPSPTAERCKKVVTGFTGMFAPYGSRAVWFFRPATNAIEHARMRPIYTYLREAYAHEDNIFNVLEFFSKEYIEVLGKLLVIATAEEAIQDRKAALLKKDVAYLEKFATGYLGLLELHAALPAPPSTAK